MEGRRVTRKNQKYNPLFILFLCLVAAVFILLVVSIVLGVRFGSANKKLKAAEAEVKELTEQVSKLEDELAAAKRGASSGSNTPALPSGENSDNPDAPALPSSTAGSSWLDLTGHNEVKVQPTNLLDGYTTYYTTAGVNLRSGPATTYDRITTVDYGEKVQVAAKEGGWSFVKVGSKFGWISSDYLSASEPTGKPATSSSTSTSTSRTNTRTEATSGSLRR